MQGYVLRRALATKDDTMVVVQNRASDEIYESLNSPNVLAQLESHKTEKSFQIKIAAAPGDLLDMTDQGKEAFSASLIQDGIQEGYRDDVLYLLTEDFEIKGRDQIIATAKQLETIATQTPKTK